MLSCSAIVNLESKTTGQTRTEAADLEEQSAESLSFSMIVLALFCCLYMDAVDHFFLCWLCHSLLHFVLKSTHKICQKDICWLWFLLWLTTQREDLDTSFDLLNSVLYTHDCVFKSPLCIIKTWGLCHFSSVLYLNWRSLFLLRVAGLWLESVLQWRWASGLSHSQPQALNWKDTDV